MTTEKRRRRAATPAGKPDRSRPRTPAPVRPRRAPRPRAPRPARYLAGTALADLVLGEPLYTPEEVARVLKVDMRTVRRLVSSGRLEAMRLGPRLVRFEREAIRRALKKPGSDGSGGGGE